jgi:hypothetical protein
MTWQFESRGLDGRMRGERVPSTKTGESLNQSMHFTLHGRLIARADFQQIFAKPDWRSPRERFSARRRLGILTILTCRGSKTETPSAGSPRTADES